MKNYICSEVSSERLKNFRKEHLYKMKESEILDMLWQRSESVLHIIDEEYGHLLQELIYRIVRDNQDVEECLNDAYMSVWNSIPPNRPEYLRAYICRIAKNIAMNHLRKKKRMKRDIDNILYIEELGECVSGEDVFEKLEEKALVEYIESFLDKQKERNRVVFIKRYWFGYSVKDISKEMGMSERHTSVVLNRLRKKLKAYLKEVHWYEK